MFAWIFSLYSYLNWTELLICSFSLSHGQINTLRILPTNGTMELLLTADDCYHWLSLVITGYQWLSGYTVQLDYSQIRVEAYLPHFKTLLGIVVVFTYQFYDCYTCNIRFLWIKFVKVFWWRIYCTFLCSICIWNLHKTTNENIHTTANLHTISRMHLLPCAHGQRPILILAMSSSWWSWRSYM